MWEMWRDDIPSLDRESWDDSLEGGPKPVISFRDKLILVKFLHRVYYTSQLLATIYPSASSACSRSQAPEASFFHMVLICPQIQLVWNQVLPDINSASGLTLGLDTAVVELFIVQYLLCLQVLYVYIHTVPLYGICAYNAIPRYYQCGGRHDK